MVSKEKDLLDLSSPQFYSTQLYLSYLYSSQEKLYFAYESDTLELYLNPHLLRKGHLQTGEVSKVQKFGTSVPLRHT